MLNGQSSMRASLKNNDRQQIAKTPYQRRYGVFSLPMRSADDDTKRLFFVFFPAEVGGKRYTADTEFFHITLRMLRSDMSSRRNLAALPTSILP